MKRYLPFLWIILLVIAVGVGNCKVEPQHFQPASIHTVSEQDQSSQRLWSVPSDVSFVNLSERPNGWFDIGWDSSDHSYERYFTFSKGGKLIKRQKVPDGDFVKPGIVKEVWNIRGQHAVLPESNHESAEFLRLKIGRNYRIIRTLPRFDSLSLEDLQFSPDGKSLYVLGPKKLWILDAQSGRILRIVKPRGSAKWSGEDEYAALSPDCREILAMKNKVTLYSTQNGKVIRHFGVHLEYFHGSCGGLDVKMYYSKNGRYVIASKQGMVAYETWVYPAHGGELCWHGYTPYEINETADGQYFLDTASIGESMNYSTFLRSWSNGKITRHLKLISPNDTEDIDPKLVFSRDGRWIYYARDNSVWRKPMPKISNHSS